MEKKSLIDLLEHKIAFLARRYDFKMNEIEKLYAKMNDARALLKSVKSD